MTVEEVTEALADNGGSVIKASLRLKVGSLVLRKFVERSARARAVIQEMKDRLTDKAQDKLEEALDSPDDRRADWAIRYVLNSKNARKLGWGSVDDAPTANPRGPLVNLVLPPIQWGDGTVIGPKEVARQIVDLTAPADK